METNLLKSVNKRIKYWWISLITGILAIILGIWCLVTPDVSLVALTYVFIFAFILSGLIEIIFAVNNKELLHGWGWSLAGGILDIVFGLLLLVIPAYITALVLVYFVGFWILFRSFGALADSFELQQWSVKGWGWLLALSIVGILFSFCFLISPAFYKGAFVIALVSVALLLFGIFRIVRAFKLRSIKKDIEEAKKEVENLKNDLRNR